MLATKAGAQPDSFIPRSCWCAGMVVGFLLAAAMIAPAFHDSIRGSRLALLLVVAGLTCVLPAIWSAWLLALVLNTFLPSRRKRFCGQLLTQWALFLVSSMVLVLWALFPDS